MEFNLGLQRSEFAAKIFAKAEEHGHLDSILHDNVRDGTRSSDAHSLYTTICDKADSHGYFEPLIKDLANELNLLPAALEIGCQRLVARKLVAIEGNRWKLLEPKDNPDYIEKKKQTAAAMGMFKGGFAKRPRRKQS